MPDATHIHLLLNHLPILGSLFGLLLLLAGIRMRNRSLEHAAFLTLIIVSLSTLPVSLSGEEAEHTVEKLPHTSKSYLEKHEDMANNSLWLAIPTGVISLFALGLSVSRRKRNRILSNLTLLLAASTFAIMVLIGNYGGKITHSELRKDSNITSPDSYGEEEDD